MIRPMKKDKYSLPAVEDLNKIGFQFEYSKLNEVIPYIKNFVAANSKVLISYYYPDKSICNSEGDTEIIVWADPAMIKDEFFDEKERELIEKIIRIEKDKIKPSDYALIVHAKHRKDKKVLLKALNKKLRGIYGATGNLVYRYGIWNLDFIESIKECLYHRLLDTLIIELLNEGKIKPIYSNKDFREYKEKKSNADNFKKANEGNPLKLFEISHYWEAEKVLMRISDELFSTNLTSEKNARIVMRRAKLGEPIITSIEKKEHTIIYYLRLQAESVNAVKDITKSNKGIQRGKREAVIDSYIADPRKSMSQIIKEILPIKVTRKTASKYIREYKMGKNNLIESTI
jgi:hypothetical protein